MKLEFNPTEIVEQLKRLNDNIELYLQHLHIRPASKDTEPVVVGRAVTEFEEAIKEHAELTGREFKYDE